MNALDKIKEMRYGKPLSSGPEINQAPASRILQRMSEKQGIDLSNAQCCNFKGSKSNVLIVLDALEAKYGEKVASEYEPAVNVKPKTKWLQDGYIVKDGEEPLCFIRTIRNGEEKRVALYHQLQVI